MFFLVYIFMAYIGGGIPTGYWWCRFRYGIDITLHGSGNIGASNVARTRGIALFPLIFIVDAGKAYAIIYWGDYLFGHGYEWYGILGAYIIAAMLLLGNAFSPFLRFKGGRGVATSCGICAYLLPWESTLILGAIWLVVVALTHQPFIASLLAMLSITVIHAVWDKTNNFYFLVFLSVWVVLQHISHLRLLCHSARQSFH
jgi:glycerol-3-phosphate acyltransferase PlsY